MSGGGNSLPTFMPISFYRWGVDILFRRMSETPTTITSQKCSAIHLQFVLQYASDLYCCAFGATELSGKGNTSVFLPFVSQYASHLYRNTPPTCIAILWLRKCGSFLSRFTGVYLVFEAFQTKVASFLFLPCSHKNAIAQMFIAQSQAPLS